MKTIIEITEDFNRDEIILTNSMGDTFTVIRTVRNEELLDFLSRCKGVKEALQQPAVSVAVCDFVPKQVCSHHGSDFYNKTCKKCSYFKQTDR